MAQDQAYLFLVFSLTGVLIGILFDFFRILRRSVKTPNIITYIQDVLFWVLTGILILYNIWYFNNGEIRLYMFLGIIMGVLVYITTLSNIIIRIFTKLLKSIIKIVELPFKSIISTFRKIFSVILLFFTKIMNKQKNFSNKKRNFENNVE